MGAGWGTARHAGPTGAARKAQQLLRPCSSLGMWSPGRGLLGLMEDPGPLGEVCMGFPPTPRGDVGQPREKMDGREPAEGQRGEAVSQGGGCVTPALL